MTVVKNLRSIIELFLNEKISVNEFDEQYRDEYINDKGPIADDLYNALDYLFFEALDYTGYPLEEGENPAFHTTEAQLRDAAKKTLEKLKTLDSQEN